jgi:hypothetical protein
MPMQLLAAVLALSFAIPAGILNHILFKTWKGSQYYNYTPRPRLRPEEQMIKRHHRGSDAAKTLLAHVSVDTDHEDVPKSERRRKRRHHPGWTFAATVVCAGILWFANFMDFWSGTPAFSGNGWILIGIMNTGITLVVFGIADACRLRLSVTPILAVLILAFSLGQQVWQAQWFPANNTRDTYGHVLGVKAADLHQFPPTTPAAIVAVAEDNAMYKARAVLNTPIPGVKNSPPLSSAYQIVECTRKPVDAHIFYICGLKPTGTVNIRDMAGKVPGFIVVDGEADTTARVVWYTMNYYVGGTGQHSLDRLVWNSGLGRQYNIDDMTLEARIVNGQWQAMYTAALVRSVFREQQGVPVGMITVDPVTGAIHRYAIADQPSWVSRTYSAGMITTLANDWGEWGTLSWTQQGTVGRYQVDGNVNLVWTDKGSAWQVLMKAKNGQDSSIARLCYASTEQPTMDCYDAPQGLQDQASATHAIVASPSNLKGQVPAELSIHEIDGILWYVAPLEAANPNNPVDPKSNDATQVPPPANGTEYYDPNTTYEPIGGVALVPATDATPNDVIIAQNMPAALEQIGSTIAGQHAYFLPGATATQKVVTGTVAESGTKPIGNQTKEAILLVGDTNAIYVGTVTGNDFESWEMSLAQPGDKVQISYYDTGATDAQGHKLLIVSQYKLLTTAQTGTGPTKSIQKVVIGAGGH